MADQIAPAVGVSDDEKMKGAVAYVLSWLTGIIVLLIAGDSKFLKFHAWQSIIFGIIITILGMILSMFCIGIIVFPLGWIYMLYGAYMVYTGKQFRMPIIADFVDKSLVK